MNSLFPVLQQWFGERQTAGQEGHKLVCLSLGLCQSHSYFDSIQLEGKILHHSVRVCFQWLANQSFLRCGQAVLLEGSLRQSWHKPWQAPATNLFILSLLCMLDPFFPVLLSHRNSDNEQLILGRYDEDVILPCLFTSGSQVVIHWKSQDNYVHSYYNGEDQLENQYFRYANRTSLVPSEISNGNASLTVRRLSLQDEGIYICYVGTTSTHTKNTVVLKVGGKWACKF